MSVFFASVASGSNGNCYYVGNHSEAVIVDAGISCRQLEFRMNRMGLAMEKVKAVFISHEHADHIFGLATLVKKWQIPVYITSSTLRNSRLSLDPSLVQDFSCGQKITIGALEILPFLKTHDAADPHSFLVSYGNTRIGIFTDIGNCCERVVHYFRQCHAVILEANYDEDMLEQGKYPIYLKARIRGGKGHLSNKEALDLFVKHRAAHLRHLILGHLSKNNNCPELVGRIFSEHAMETQITVASRFQESPVYQLPVNGNEEISIYNEQLDYPSMANAMLSKRKKAFHFSTPSNTSSQLRLSFE